MKYSFYFECLHIEGLKNKDADILSRNDDILRKEIYLKYNKKPCIPTTTVTNILNYTCINKFCSPLKLI